MWGKYTWHELDRPVQYAILARSHTIVPVKVYSMAPRWNGAALKRTLTLLDDDLAEEGISIDFHPQDVFETKDEARKEVFLRQLKGGWIK
jgi:hypothetical protein